jgi:hypothetical protein
MVKNRIWLFFAAVFVFLTYGCGAPLLVGGVAAGTGTGAYFYVTGGLQAEYNTSFDKLWTACEKTMADMRALNVLPVKEIGKGTISAVINNANVQFAVKYKAKNAAIVTVRVGFFGDNTASQLLLDKIGDNVSKN